MIVRVRLPDGSTVRHSVESGDTLYDLAKKIHDRGALAPEFQLYADPRWSKPFRDSAASIAACGLNNGDLVFLKGEMAAASQEKCSSGSEAPPDPSPNDGSRNNITPCSHCAPGRKAMCSRCAPQEDKAARYQAELSKWKDRKGTSMAVLEALDAMKFRVQPQKEVPSVTAVSVDRQAAAAFQGYLVECSFNQQRFGFVYGKLDDEQVARIDAIYEPPQQGDQTKYAPMPEQEAGDITERADRVGQELGLKRFGVIFSTKQRKAILSGLDVLTVAGAQAEEESKHGQDHARQMVILVVSLTDENQTHFEAYQLSDQCLEMYKAGVFLPADEQKPNSGRIKTRDTVFVEGKEVKSVHTEFFLITQPIRDHVSFLRTEFPVENRELRPQQHTDMRDTLQRSQNIPFYKRVSDFHLLLYLSNSFNLTEDMPGLMDAVRDQREFSEEEEGLKILIEGM